MNKEKIKYFLVFILAVCIVFLAFTAHVMYKQKIIKEVSSKFTCACCEGSVYEASSSCLAGQGMNNFITAEAGKSLSSEKVMLEAVKKLGVASLINESLIKEYGLLMLNNTPEDVPNISVTPAQIDLGEVSNSKGILITDFKIKNDGKADLLIYDMSTSCACLFVSLIKNGEETSQFGRFSNPHGFALVIEPGKEATLRTYYDPRTTNWQTGHVERIITITSNDPIYFNYVVKLSAELVP